MRWRAAAACVSGVLAAFMFGACTFGDLGDYDRGQPEAGSAPARDGSSSDAAPADVAASIVGDGQAGAPPGTAEAGSDGGTGCDPGGALIVGNKTDPTNAATDDTGGGYMDCYGFVAATNATAQCAFLYIDAPPSTAPAYVAVYAESDAGAPDALLATAQFTAMVPGWNAARLDRPLTVAPGEHVWLGVGAPTGVVHYRYHSGTCTGLEDHADTTAPNGPANPFNAFKTFPNACDLLAYLTP